MNSFDTHYNLILKEGEKIIFTSKKRGLKPLLECIVKCSGRLHNASLTDKIVGGAGARLIVMSKMICRVRAGVISDNALRYLTDHSITAEWEIKTPAILRADGRGICPMEELSNRLPDDIDYIFALLRHFSM